MLVDSTALPRCGCQVPCVPVCTATIFRLHLAAKPSRDGGDGGIDGPDRVASSRIVGALASIIFPTPHKIHNDDRLPQHVSGVSG